MRFIYPKMKYYVFKSPNDTEWLSNKIWREIKSQKNVIVRIRVCLIFIQQFYFFQYQLNSNKSQSDVCFFSLKNNLLVIIVIIAFI